MRPDHVRNISNGKCRQGCGRDLVSKAHCQECLNKLKRDGKIRRRNLIESGKCRDGCGRNLETGKTRCRECLDRMNSQRTTHNANGKCQAGCGRDLVKGKKSCQECLDKRVARQYGITAKDLQKKRSLQNGACAICEIVPNKPLHTDHHHSEGYIRDMLCEDCNHAVGVVHESPLIARRVASYITHHNKYKGSRPFKPRSKPCNI